VLALEAQNRGLLWTTRDTAISPCELLFGAMLTQTGFVTDVVLVVYTIMHWKSYYKWLHFGKWSWVALGLQTARLALQMFTPRRWLLMIDDTIVSYRQKKPLGWPSISSTAINQSFGLCQRAVLGDVGTYSVQGLPVSEYPDPFPSGS
jgi:hypothetical protein